MGNLLPAWESMAPRIRGAIAEAWRYGMPVEASALFGRWWQMETWLRSLAYVELKARDGEGWTTALGQPFVKRQASDKSHAYMATADSQAQLAYLDAGLLFGMLDNNWTLFADSLIEREVWTGRVVELKKIRNRIGHCRRPRIDDLGRLEQTLRDIEPGALRAVRSFNRRSSPSPDLKDVLVHNWVRHQHADAGRLVAHADRQYYVTFRLRYSRRPWAEKRGQLDPVSGRAGYLWHASWIIGEGALDLKRFWDDSPFLFENTIFVSSDSPAQLEVSFPAKDDPALLSDLIGNTFDSLLTNIRRAKVHPEIWESWGEMNSELDWRVQIASPWSIDDTMDPITMFGV